MITFAYPWLLLLLPVPLLVRWLVPPHKEQKAAVAVPFMGRLMAASGARPAEGAVVARRSLAQGVLLIVVWLCAVGALARPQWVGEPISKTLPSRDLLLAVDLSGSMDTEDFTEPSGGRVDRLAAVKLVLEDFLTRRKGDRVGLIFFGTAPFVQAPFTEDLEVLRTLLDEAQVRMAGPQTMLGDAIGLAITVFQRSDLDEQVLILLTDGNDTGSKVPPEQAARIARDQGITIHTVAVGDPQAAGEEKLDEETLRAIATTTAGGYFRAEDREQLQDIYRRLDELGTREIETISHRPKWDLFHWPLATLVLLTLGYHSVMAALTRRARNPKLETRNTKEIQRTEVGSRL